MSTKEIIVLSPRLDDAVVSCCDHILMWSARFRIEINTGEFFTD